MLTTGPEDVAFLVAAARTGDAAALDRLSPAYRETLVLRLVEGLDGPEIAMLTGLTPGRVRAARVIAAGVQFAVYAMLLALPVGGDVLWVWMDASMAVLGPFELPKLFDPTAADERGCALAWYVHVWDAWILAALVALHVGAAAWQVLRPTQTRSCSSAE